MDIMIKGFQMPENCVECVMQVGGWCGAAPPEVDERVAPTVNEAVKQGKPEWCPLYEVKPVRGGQWMRIEEYNTVRCSSCRCVFDSWMASQSFCPHCGARMDSGVIRDAVSG